MASKQSLTLGQRAVAFWNHPAGPKTIHFWAPTFKWGISIANIADFQRPAEQVSYPQQIAVTATGVIWSRFSTQITPVSVQAQPSYRLSAVAAIEDQSLMTRYSEIASTFSQVNYNLLTVNAFMALTGLYQLARKINYDFLKTEDGAKEKKS